MSRTTDINNRANLAPTPGLGDIASQAFNKQLRLLQISDMFSRKTDLELLFECFYTESQSLVASDGLSFSIADSTEELMFGRKRQNAIFFDLSKGGSELGVLKLYTREQPQAKEIRELEALLPCLIYPLETALETRRAKFASWMDELTGINNQLALDELLPREMLLSREAEEPLSLLMIDLDHFQKTSEAHGDQAGDQIIMAVAEALLSNLRSSDVIFRQGHDRFIVILGSTDFDDATMVSERLRTCVERSFSYENVHLVQNASAGVTEMVDDDNAASLLVRAESALVNAKRAGRNQVRFLAASESN